METQSCLKMKGIKPSLPLMRLLPADLAFKYHALPVSTDGTCITVAAAFPDDAESFAAICSAIGAPVRLIQADLEDIDKQIANLWPQKDTRKNIVLWASTADSKALKPFTQTFSDMVGGCLIRASSGWKSERTTIELSSIITEMQPDLIIFHPASGVFLRKMLSDGQLQDKLPALLLIPEEVPSLINKVLLPVLDDDADVDLALKWIVGLARSSEIKVEVLPLLPPVPRFYGSFLCHSIQALLEEKDPFGIKIRHISERFSNEGIQGVFFLQDGDPLEQIQQLINSTNPDLIILSSSFKHLTRVWGISNLVKLLTGWVKQPLLIPPKQASN